MVRQLLFLTINICFLFGCIASDVVHNFQAQHLIAAYEFFTGITVLTLTWKTPNHKSSCNYYMLTGAMFLHCILDLWELHVYRREATFQEDPFLGLLFTIPAILVLISAICHFRATAHRFNRRLLILDSYQISIVIIAIFSSSLSDLFDIRAFFHRPLTLNDFTMGIFAITSGLTFILAFIMLASRRIKRNHPIYLGLITFYILIMSRTTFIIFGQLGILVLPPGTSEYLLMISCFSLCLTVIYRDYVFQKGLFSIFDPRTDPPENIGHSGVMYHLALISIALWTMGILTMHSLFLIILIIAILKGMDFFAQQAYTINEQLKFQLTKDSLTQLYNRTYCISEISRRIASRDHFTLFYADLDRFKVLNDIYGHHVGDLVLKKIAERLQQLTRKGIFVSRSGGDEFTLIVNSCEPITRHQTGLLIAETIKKRIIINDNEFFMKASIGSACYPHDAKDTFELLKYADIAMYNAKQSNGGTEIVEHSEHFTEHLARRNKIEILLQNENCLEDFKLFYQAQIDTTTEKLVGMEALARWFHPTEGFISPGEFIPIAEEIGKIKKITTWVLKTAIQQIKQWNEQYQTDLVMAINISPKFIYGKFFLDSIQTCLDQFKVNPEWIAVEITEHSAMSSPTTMQQILQAISKMGLKISIDDFGTGYSSLSYLKRFEVNELKIAKELINNIATDQDEFLIVNAIIKMAQGLGLTTVAEGVEINEQLQLLKLLGCNTIQGYYFNRPMSATDFEESYFIHPSTIPKEAGGSSI